MDTIWMVLSLLMLCAAAVGLTVMIRRRERSRRGPGSCRERDSREATPPLLITGQGTSRKEVFGCSRCGNLFDSFKALSLHMKDVHPGVPGVFPSKAWPSPINPEVKKILPAAAVALMDKYGGASLDAWIARAIEGKIELADVELMISLCHGARHAAQNRLRVQESQRRTSSRTLSEARLKYLSARRRAEKNSSADYVDSAD